MSSREEILNRLRGNVRETYDFPDLGFKKLEFADPVAQYIETTTTTAGARVFEIKPTDDINAKIREAYPDARIIASNIPGVLADKNPDTVERAQDLEDVDVGVIKGEVACAENGCVWVPQTMKEKAICFASETLHRTVARLWRPGCPWPHSLPH